MKTLTIVADDKVGLLADISYILGKSKINIDTINVEVVSQKAMITLGLHDFDKAKSVLEASGYKVTEANMVVVKLNDQPGELSRITKLLAKEGINIENVLMLSRDTSNTVLAIAVDKPKRASELLKDVLVGKEI
jgi:hypothetical protein